MSPSSSSNMEALVSATRSSGRSRNVSMESMKLWSVKSSRCRETMSMPLVEPGFDHLMSGINAATHAVDPRVDARFKFQ